MKPRAATHSRREFVQLAGMTTFALAATRRVHAEFPRVQREVKHMEIKRSGSQASSKGPADWFTGSVRVDPLFQVHEPARAAGASVTFEPGASVPGRKSCKEFRERVWQTIAASSDWSTSTRRGGRRGGCTPARTPPHE